MKKPTKPRSDSRTRVLAVTKLAEIRGGVVSNAATVMNVIQSIGR